MQRITKSLVSLPVCGLAMLLAACGGAKAPDAPVAGSEAAAAPVAVSAKSAPTEKSEMVAAVTMGKPGAPVEMRFDLPARPAVGQPLTIKLELTPRSAVLRLQATVTGIDGLDVSGSTELESVDRPAVDVAIARSVTVTPQREGMFYLPVTVYTSEASATASRSFAIPLIVGAGGAAAAAQKPATTTDAGGERIERTAAQESTTAR